MCAQHAHIGTISHGISPPFLINTIRKQISRCLRMPHIGLKPTPAAMQQDALGIMQSPSLGISSIGTATYVLFDEIQDIPGQQCYPLFLIPPIIVERGRGTNHSDMVYTPER